MVITVLKDFKHLKGYTKLIENKIISELWNAIYKPLFKDANTKSKNAQNVIIEALERGEIFYVDGGFKAKKQFSNAVSKELIKLGAKYNKYTRVFEISQNLSETETIQTGCRNFCRHRYSAFLCKSGFT